MQKHAHMRLSDRQIPEYNWYSTQIQVFTHILTQL